MTGGTTTTEVARALADRERLTVVTNSLSIASELAVRPNLKLVVTGGVARDRVLRAGRPAGRERAGNLNLDLVVIGVDGIAVDAGFTTHHEVEAHTNRALIARPPRDRGSRQLQDRPGRLRPHLRPGGGHEADHRRGGRPRQMEAIRAAGIEVTIVEAGPTR